MHICLPGPQCMPQAYTHIYYRVVVICIIFTGSYCYNYVSIRSEFHIYLVEATYIRELVSKYDRNNIQLMIIDSVKQFKADSRSYLPHDIIN